MFHSFTAQSPFKHSNTNLHGSIEQMHKAHHIIPLSGGVVLDPTQMTSLRDAAHTRAISSQVIKRSLYESVVSQRISKRRYSMAINQRPQSVHGEEGKKNQAKGRDDWGDNESIEGWREVQSMPVSPCLSPRLTPKRFCLMKGGETDSTMSSSHKINLSQTSLIFSSIKKDIDLGLNAITQPARKRFIPSNTDLTNIDDNEDCFKIPELPTRFYSYQQESSPCKQGLDPISSESSLCQSTMGSPSMSSLYANQGVCEEEYDKCADDVRLCESTSIENVNDNITDEFYGNNEFASNEKNGKENINNSMNEDDDG